MTQPRRNRIDHWPHAAEHARRHFDPDQIEQHALRIIARGIRTQRLVAFVGAGASMAYGRLTWSGLMDFLYDTLGKQAEGNVAALWRDITKRLWGSRVSNFRREPDHPVKAEILAEIFRLIQIQREQQSQAQQKSEAHPADASRSPCTPPADLHGWTTACLASYQGYVDDVLRKVHEATGHRASTLSNTAIQKMDASDPARTGLRGASDAIQRWARAPRNAKEREELRQALTTALQLQPMQEDAPLRHLVMEWGIRRFITTNYDGEIERALEDFGFHRANAKSAGSQTPRQRTLNFNAATTGEALAFAFDGSRRHAEVLHLHGDNADPRSLIVTESDYQRLYLSEHAQRDLVTNASLANFAANPMLFVGSEVNEDDVLRPIRQFMTGPGHRSDRMAIAVFASTKSSQERAMQAAKLLLKYRVHAVFAGSATLRPSAGKNEPNDEHWLYHFVTAGRSFKALIEEITSAKNQQGEWEEPQWDGDRIRSALDKFNSDWERVRPASDILEIEGLPFVRQTDTGAVTETERLYPDTDLSFLNTGETLTIGGDAPRAALNLSSWKYHEFIWRQVQFEQRVNVAMNCFVCAKLISLRRQVDDQIEAESRLPGVFRKEVAAQPFEAERPTWVIHSRHRVCMQPETVVGRFAGINASSSQRLVQSPDEVFAEGIPLLASAIEKHRGGKFAQSRGRRLVVVCAARGAGKGGQFDHLLRRPQVPTAEKPAPESGDNEATAGKKDGPPLPPALVRVLEALSPTDKANAPRTVLHFNLSFADEVAGMVSHLCDAVFYKHPDPPQDWSRSKDLLERLSAALIALRRRQDGHRLVLVLGNAGVLFDADGEAKNGLIHRVLRMLQARRHRAVPLDVIMYVGESQVPAHLRRAAGSGEPAKAAGRPVTSIGLPNYRDQRMQRRLRRLNIRQHLDDDPAVLVHPLQKTRADQLAAAYFSDLWNALTPDTTASGEGGDSDPISEAVWRDLYLETGGSRFSQTMILACVDALAGRERQTSTEMFKRMLHRLRGAASQSSVSASIEMVLDTWAHRFVVGPALPACAFPQPQRKDSDLERCLKHLQVAAAAGRPAGRACWDLCMEMLWHFAAFSHPIELPTLLACERVASALKALRAQISGDGQDAQTYGFDTDRPILDACAECLTHWALLFRVAPCVLPVGLDQAAKFACGSRYRYGTHRHVQRHFLKLMGGRNVEATYWDQFTTTLYASQPDEAPVLRADVHRTLSGVVQSLTHYPLPDHLPPPQPQGPECAAHVQGLVEQADRIRAAYFLLRSTYSMGVVANLTSQGDSASAAIGGHLEQYRRLVRWTIHAARYWEDEYDALRGRYWKHSSTDTKMGIFYPGELVWLYNECGVVSLAQGKLHDAEQLLSHAEIATRAIENDDTGSLHTRIRLHAALTHIERGRPHQARQMLQPIAARTGGHSVPPYLAKFYLGLLEHISGNYHQAEGFYSEALAGLHQHRRSRAAAFVLMNQADLKLRASPSSEARVAIATAQEAISLAQQGGHEDLRHLAHLARVRLCIQTNTIAGEMLFEELNAAQRYAVRMDIPRIACEVHELRARLLSTQGEYMLSAAEATRSLEIAALYDLKLLKARGMLTLAKIYAQRGEIGGAKDLVRAGKEIATSADYFTCVRGFTKLEMGLERPASGPH